MEKIYGICCFEPLLYESATVWYDESMMKQLKQEGWIMIGAKRLPSFLGLDARHYPVAGRRDKVVITLSGSEGGLWLAKNRRAGCSRRAFLLLPLDIFAPYIQGQRFHWCR